MYFLGGLSEAQYSGQGSTKITINKQKIITLIGHPIYPQKKLNILLKI